MSSRWTDTPEDLEHAARLKAEKAARKAAKEEARRRREAAAAAAAAAAKSQSSPPPSKKRRTNPSSPNTQNNNSNNNEGDDAANTEIKPLRFPAPEIVSCRHVDSYEPLNRIEEGSYGIVSRARDSETGEIVALKRLKLERETDGFPITSLREIRTLLAARQCPGVVGLREVVMGDGLKEYVIISPDPFIIRPRVVLTIYTCKAST